MSDASPVEEIAVIFDEDGVAHFEVEYRAKKNSYIGVMLDKNHKLSFYETYTEPADHNNVFATFEEAKMNAIEKWEKRLLAVQQQLQALKDTTFSTVIPIGTEDNLHG